MKTKKYNTTTSFILPLIGKPRSFYEPYLIDSYFANDLITGYNQYHISVLCKFHGNRLFSKMEDDINSMEQFRDSFDILDETHVVYIFEVPDKYKNDYDNFLIGKYSKFSNDAKHEVVKNANKSSSIGKVFVKHGELRRYWEKQTGCSLDKTEEVWPIIYDQVILESEVLNDTIVKRIDAEREKKPYIT